MKSIAVLMMFSFSLATPAWAQGMHDREPLACYETPEGNQSTQPTDAGSGGGAADAGSRVVTVVHTVSANVSVGYPQIINWGTGNSVTTTYQCGP